MNFLKSIFITTILLNIRTAHASEQQSLAEMLQDIPNPFETTTIVHDSAKTETNPLDMWNNHLQALKDQDENWNATSNSPTDSWIATAYNLAADVLKKDPSLADSLETDFAKALNAKTTNFADIMKVIKDFEKFIKDKLAELTPVVAEIPSVPPAPTMPELVTPEPTAQPEPETSATTDTTSSTTTTSSTESTNTETLNQQWKDQLKKLATSGTNWNDINANLQEIYTIAQQLYKDQDVQKMRNDFISALTARKDNGLNLQPHHNKTLLKFDAAVGLVESADEYQPVLYQSTPQIDPQLQYGASEQVNSELKKLQEQLAQQDAQARANAEEQKQREEELRRKEIELQAAVLQSKEAGKVSERRLSIVQQEVANLEAKLKKDENERTEKLAAEQKILKQNIAKLAEAQKAESEKGIIASVMDWWSGSSKNQKEIEKHRKTIRKSFKNLALQYPQAGSSLHQFETLLFSFEKPIYWDQANGTPNQKWVDEVLQQLMPLVITHQALTDVGAYALIKAMLKSKMPRDKISAFVSDTIEKPITAQVHKNIMAQKEQEERVLRIAQQKKERKEQIALAQQKIKDEQDRIAAQEKRQLAAATNYKNEKKQWYTLLQNMSQHSNATQEDNQADMQEAIKKSQSLLQLAGDIPKKNKAAISQKLKQKFTVALLEQQKNGESSVNVHRNMDIFNNEVNKMID